MYEFERGGPSNYKKKIIWFTLKDLNTPHAVHCVFYIIAKGKHLPNFPE